MYKMLGFAAVRNKFKVCPVTLSKETDGTSIFGVGMGLMLRKRYLISNTF